MIEQPIQYCALPECGKPFRNWRVKCCCISHQKRYAGKLRHGTLGLPDKVSKRKSKRIPKEHTVKYYKIKSQSKPLWADNSLILEFYKKAQELCIETGMKYEVDHIIPLSHPLVCGLHNQFNLQILTKSKNCQKSNTFIIE